MKFRKLKLMFGLFILSGVGGCGALGSALFAAHPCDLPFACGVSGQVLRTTAAVVSEVMALYGDETTYIWSLEADITGGLAFSKTSRGLRLYVAFDDGLRDYPGGVSGRTNKEPKRITPVPDCKLGDIVVKKDGHVIASCQDTRRLVEIDPEAMQVVESFTCCDGVDEAFDPFALAISPNGTVLAGTTRIYEFNAVTGGLVGLAIEAGVMGATSYYDYEFGPDGNLYVVANPSAGIFVFDGESFELVDVLIPGGIERIPLLGAITFDLNGRLLVGSFGSTRDGNPLIELNAATGNIIRWRPEVGEEDCCTPGSSRGNFFIAVRP